MEDCLKSGCKSKDKKEKAKTKESFPLHLSDSSIPL